MSDLLNIDCSLPIENDEKLKDDILPNNNGKFNTKINQNILICALKFIKDSRRFDNPNLKYLYSSRTIFYFASCIIYDDVLIFCRNS